MADGHVAALGGSIAGGGNLQYLTGYEVGQVRFDLGDASATLNNSRGGNHDRAQDGGEVPGKDGLELVVIVRARQMRQHVSRVPLEDLVLVAEQPDEEVKMRVEHVRA